MKKLSLIFFGVIIAFFMMSFVSAITSCTSSLISLNNNHKHETDFRCLNEGNTTVTLSSSLDYVLVSPTIINPGENPYIHLFLTDETPIGTNQGYLTFSDSTSQIQINVVMADEDPNSCQLRPSSSGTTQSVQQGTKNENWKTISFDPINCDGSVNLIKDENVVVEGGIFTSEGLQKPIYISEIINSNKIRVGLDTANLPSQPYNPSIKINQFGEEFLIPFTIIVTGGTNPDTNFDISNLPTCSLTSNILNLNSTYSLVCTGIVSGVTIHPIIDNDYIKGLGPGDGMTSTNFVWEFQPKKMGNTFIVAEFRYSDLPVGEIFSQEIKIQSTGTQTQGTDLAFHFSPSLEQATEGEEIIVQLIDNKTGSLVESPEIYLDSIKVNSINTSEKSFPLNLQINKNYELRGVAPGYSNIIKTISINPKFIEIVINPAVGDTSTMFNVSTDINNATLKINGMTVDNPFYGTLSPGENIIEASLSGYQVKTINFTVKDYIRVVDGGFNFKKGEQQNLTLNRNVTSWTVYYQKKLDSVERETLLTGTGSKIDFTPKKSGVYYIEADGFSIATYQAEGFSFSEKWWIFPIWGWIIVVVLALAIIIFVIYLKGESSPSGADVSEGGWEV